MGKRVREVIDENSDEGAGEGISKNIIQLYPALFKDDTLSKGGVVKARGVVLKEHSRAISRPPNMSCRIQAFGRICKTFDERRIRWVTEMGFGGLLHFISDMHLPRQLAYWLMTRIDPLNKLLIAPDGRVFPLSKNQVRWILGIPCGSKVVPSNKTMTEEVRGKVQQVLLKYGCSWKTKSSRGCGSVYTSVGIPVTCELMERLESSFCDDEEEEFKTIFLIVVLYMVLCPTQSPRLASDLLPAISCVSDCVEYDWCEVVLRKLMDSVASFSRRFYANGYAGECGGCAIFVVIFYLDRLDRQLVLWDSFPRLKVWTKLQIATAAKEDRTGSGDFGKLGLLDVAYGENHCMVARDNEPPIGVVVHNDVLLKSVCNNNRNSHLTGPPTRSSCSCGKLERRE